MNSTYRSSQQKQSPVKNEVMLLKDLKENREPAFRKLYTDYRRGLLSVILKMVRNDEEAEDILQETFINISKNIYSYDPGKGKLFTWMARVARNKAFDYLKSPAVRNTEFNLNLVELEEEFVLSLQSSDFNIESIGVKTLTDRLNASQKKVIDLIYFNGYTYMEVAEELNMPLGTVKTKNRMAMNSLRALFDDKTIILV